MTRRIRVARIIGRLNIGGPAIQAITLTKLLEARGYDTRLIRGSEGSHEGSLDDLAKRYGVETHLIRGLRRDLHLTDVKAVARLVGELRVQRPDIVHTHLAKAGALGRTAALVAGLRPRPILVHTYHGHSLEGYFSGPRQAVFTRIERTLSMRCDRIVAVAPEVAADLLRLRVAAPERTVVIPVGFDLSGYVVDGDERDRRRAAARRTLGVPDDVPLVTLVARLVPIKRVDRFMRVARRIAVARADVRFAIVGDGELGPQLRASPDAAALGERLVWAGFRRDIPDVCFASDAVVLTSDNEGTPVSLIEAQAAAVPVVSTEVGGAATVVLEGRTGRLVAPDDDAAFSAAVLDVLSDPAAALTMGGRGREHVLATFSLDRLVDDIDGLYRRLLAERG